MTPEGAEITESDVEEYAEVVGDNPYGDEPGESSPQESEETPVEQTPLAPEAPDEGEPVETPVEGQEPEGEPLYEVEVDGKKEKVTLADLKRGYMMGKTFTQRSQQLAQERRAFEAERARLSAAGQLQPGLGGGAQPADAWGAFTGAAQPAPVQQAAQPVQQPYGTMPDSGVKPQTYMPPGGEDDIVTPAQLAHLQAQISQQIESLRAENQALIEQQRQAAAEQANMQAVRTQYPDLDEDACMAEFYLKPPREQAALRKMPYSQALKLIHLERRARQQGQPAGAAQTGQRKRARKERTPMMEKTSRQAPGEAPTFPKEISVGNEAELIRYAEYMARGDGNP